MGRKTWIAVCLALLLVSLLGLLKHAQAGSAAETDASPGFVLAYIAGDTVIRPEEWGAYNLPKTISPTRSWFGYNSCVGSTGGSCQLHFHYDPTNAPIGLARPAGYTLVPLSTVGEGEPIIIKPASIMWNDTASFHYNLRYQMTIVYSNVPVPDLTTASANEFLSEKNRSSQFNDPLWLVPLDQEGAVADTPGSPADLLVLIPANLLPDQEPLVETLDAMYMAELPSVLFRDFFIEFADESSPGVQVLAEYYGDYWQMLENRIRNCDDPQCAFSASFPEYGEPHIVVLLARGEDSMAAVSDLLGKIFRIGEITQKVAPWYQAIPSYATREFSMAEIHGLRRYQANSLPMQDAAELVAPDEFVMEVTALSSVVIIALAEPDGRVHLQFFQGTHGDTVNRP